VLGETGETWDRGKLGHYDYFHELTLVIDSIYLLTDVQVPMFIYCCYLWYYVEYCVSWNSWYFLVK